MDEPRITIVVPTLRSGPELRRCLDSLLGQDYPNLEVIVADGEGGPDRNPVLAAYRGHFQHWLRGPDGGQADGLNRGFELADGTIYGWLCADDELLPGTLRHVADLFLANPRVDVITGACERRFDDGTGVIVPPDVDPWANIGARNVIEQPSTFWRASLYRQVGPLDTSFHLGFDWDLWARMRGVGAQLLTTPQVLSRYHFSVSNKSSQAGNRFAEEAFRLVHRYGPRRGLLARGYRCIYRHFDLHGCLDRDTGGRPLRCLLYPLCILALYLVLGKQGVAQYNWHFASLQERGRVWWKG